MKRVTPNITDVVTVRFVAQQAYIRKFLRYWGTETINGVEVFKERRYYYKDMDDDMVGLAKLLGIYGDLTAKQEGVRSAWLYLNPKKAEDTTVNWNRSILAANINRALNGLTGGTVVIAPKVHRKTLQTPPIATDPTNQAGLEAEIRANFNTYWASGYPVFTNQEDPFKAIVLSYLLRVPEIPFEITGIEKIAVGITKPPSTSQLNYLRTEASPAWRVRLNLSGTTVSPDSALVTKIISDLGNRDLQANAVIGILFDTASAEYDARDGEKYEEEPLYEAMPTSVSSYWLKIPQYRQVYDYDLDSYITITTYKYYLKASILQDTTLKTGDRIKYISSCIDSDYKKEKREWWEDALAVIIVVAATVFAGPAGAAAAGAVTAGAVATVVLVAVTITVAAMYITLATAALYHMGAPNVSAALGTFMKNIDPLVRIAGVIAFIYAIYRVVGAGLEKAAEKAAEEAGKEAAKASATSIAAEIGKEVITQFTGIPMSSNIQLVQVVKVVDLAFGLYQKHELKKLSKEIENYRSELAAMQELVEQSQTSDLLKDLSGSYTLALARDNSEYSERYDRPYEWWSTPYHTGNIQATTVNALWISES